MKVFNICRKFSTTVSMARGALYRQILTEQRHENNKYEQEEAIFQKLNSLGFQYEEVPNSIRIRLKKQVLGNRLTIEFKATTPPVADQIELEKPSDSEDSDLDTKFEDNRQENIIEKRQREADKKKLKIYPLSVDYTVLIQSDKGEAIALECNTCNSTTTINYIQPVYDSEEYLQRSKPQKFLFDYPGPEVNNLETNLRQAIYDYLLSLGVNQELNSVIEAYALDKEQRVYMEFLSRMEKFLS